MKIVFKNVRKLRGMDKQRKAIQFLIKEGIYICGVTETGQNDDQMTEGGKHFNWFGMNRKSEKGKSGE